MRSCNDCLRVRPNGCGDYQDQSAVAVLIFCVRCALFLVLKVLTSVAIVRDLNVMIGRCGKT